MNKRITTTASNGDNIGCIVGYDWGYLTTQGDFTWIGMPAMYNWNGTTGTNKIKSIGSLTKDGEGISITYIKTQTVWDSADFNFNGSPWTWDNNYMPSLHGEHIDWPDWLNTGTGSSTDPLKVYDVETLSRVGKPTSGGAYDNWTLSAQYIQIADIDLSLVPLDEGSNFTPIGYYYGATNNEPFGGTYDGGGHSISNMIIDNSTVSSQAMFGYINRNGTVKNLKLSCTINGRTYSGGLVGNNGGAVEKIVVSGSVSGSNYVGGVAGNNTGGTVKNCYFYGSVIGSNDQSSATYFGGVVGYNVTSGLVQNCYAAGSIRGYNSGAGATFVGGIVGQNYNTGSTVENCVALNQSVTNASSSTMNVGRVVGNNTAILNNNYAWDNIDIRRNTNSDGIGGTVKSITTTGVNNDVDGAGIDAIDLITKIAVWETAGFSFGSGNPWIWDSGEAFMPSLHGEQFPWPQLIPAGDGTPGDPFKIYNIATLKKIGSETTAGGWTFSANYEQIINIDLSSVSNWEPIGRYTPTASQFTGTYDGNGYSISNLSISSNGDYQGLFGYINGGKIMNLKLTDCTISGRQYVGGITGYLNGAASEITNCSVTGSVKSTYSSTNYVGGIAGQNNSGLVKDCNTACTVTGVSNYVGGIVGYLSGNTGRVTNCYTIGNVTGDLDYVGGIAGNISGSSTNYSIVQNCYAKGNISGNSNVGGVVGSNSYSRVQNCYATGDITGTSGNVGGVAGNSTSANCLIQNCYATGSVKGGGNYIGGVVGYSNNASAKLQNCVALNPSVTNTTASSTNLGRVAGAVSGASTVANNYARSDLKLYVSTDTEYSGYTTGLTDKNGYDITSAQWGAESWWTTPANWNIDAWEFTTVWEWGANNLPILRNVGGEQNPEIQN